MRPFGASASTWCCPPRSSRDITARRSRASLASSTTASWASSFSGAPIPVSSAASFIGESGAARGSFTASVAARHDACTVVSDGEQTSLESFLPAGAMVRVVPNGADVQGQRGDFGDPEPDSLVYPGALTYHANLNAMEYFLERIFPLLRSRRPAVILRITGEPGRAGRRLVARRGAGVVLTGPLEDVRPCVATSRACVIPLRIGGGTRVKILEAMALGTPVVATPKGAEGLHVADGNDLLIARPPEDFAVAVRRLLEDDSLRWRIADTARRTVAEQYDWRLCLRPLEALHGELASRGGRAREDARDSPAQESSSPTPGATISSWRTRFGSASKRRGSKCARTSRISKQARRSGEALQRVIRHSEYLVLVATPGALESASVEREWRLAREEGCA